MPSRGDSKYSNDQAFVSLRTTTVPYGNNTIEISVISEFETFDPEFVSKAQVEIKRIAFTGTINGGASRCIDVPEGSYAPAKSVYPSWCPAG